MSNRSNSALHAIAIALATVGIAVGPCPAQSGQTQEPQRVADPPMEDADLKFSISAGYQHIFNTNLDGGGTYQIDRVGLELKARTRLSDEWRLDFNLKYLFDDYKFTDAVNLGGNPWSDINTLLLDARAQWWMTNDLALIFGPFLMWSRESKKAAWPFGVATLGILVPVLIATASRSKVSRVIVPSAKAFWTSLT